MKFLHVEDDASFRQFVALALENTGFTIDACSTGAEALERLQQHPRDYDLLNLDLVLPYINPRRR